MTKRGNDSKKERMKRYMDDWRNSGGDFHPALRLILPHLDKARTSYGMKEKVLAKTYVEVLGLAVTSPDAESLMNWRNPGKSGKTTAGDFPGVLYQIIVGRSNMLGKSTVSVADVNEQLDLLDGAQGKEDRRDIIKWFFQHCTPMEQSWIARVILKDLKLGISEHTILNIWHPDGLEKFNVCNDLSEVTSTLRDPRKRLDQTDVSLFRPFKPMPSKRVDSMPEVLKHMAHSTFWIETKLDGERIQMHMRRNETGAQFGWWSRKATNYTEDYGSTDKDGALAPYIIDMFEKKVKTVILDGELLAYNTETSIYEPFGSLKSASNEVRKLGINAKLRVCFIAFDVVYLNGKSLLDQPLKNRYEVLLKVFKEKKTYFELNPHQEGRTIQDLTAALDKRMEHMEEGLCVKNPMSTYLPSGKPQTDWLKVKPDYMSGYGDDVDVLLVGGFYGEGRRGGVLSHFMCAVIEDPIEGQPQRCLSFCKFGSGYKMDEIESISRQAEGQWRPYDPKKLPPWFVHPRNSKEKPDMILSSPEHAIVVQLKGFEITKSEIYGCGYTMRFPRFVKIRDDKTPETSLSVSGLQSYLQKGSGRMQTRQLLDPSVEARVKPKTASHRVPTVSAVKLASQHLGIDRTQVLKTDDMFSGMEFCVLPGAGVTSEAAARMPPRTSALQASCADKRAIETSLLQHGANVVQNPTDATKMLIADQHTLKVSNLKQAGTYDMVQSRYILECLAAKEVVPLSPRHMIFATSETLERFKENVDRWGDSYVEDLRVSTMKELFDLMEDSLLKPRKRKAALDASEAEGNKRYRNNTILEIDEKYFSMAPHEGALFRRARVYVDRFVNLRITTALADRMNFHDGSPPPEVVLVSNGEDPIDLFPRDRQEDCRLDIVSLKLRARGAVVVEAIDPLTTHIVVDQKASTEAFETRTRVLLRLLSTLPDRMVQRQHLLGQAWVDECIRVGRMVGEREFEVGVVPGRGVVIGGLGKAPSFVDVPSFSAT
ncbi:DNA ligase (ATP) [Thoreauomyces humboldtii]|nr:DNA ligase (ATP) [Thoreauomyces humboldtii]